MPGCVRHPDRPTGLRCTRCDRPACPDCLREASVGYQCVDCVNQSKQTVIRPAMARRSRGLVVVPILIVLNLAVFAITVYQANSFTNNDGSQLFQDWFLLPGFAADGDWWRLLTSGFLHFGPIHIAMNMLALYVLGRDLELLLGRIRFTVLYVVSLFGGGASVFLFGALNTPVAGASGAVFGVMGGLLVVALRRKLNAGPAVGMIVINLVISVSLPGISLLGHVGGLVVGAIAAAAMEYAPAKSRLLWQVGGVVALVIVLVGLVAVRDAQYGQLDCNQVTGCQQVSSRP
jgi:membrane associated rhomboid family serine protease